MKRLAVALTAILTLALFVSPALAGKLDDIKKKGVLVAGVKDSQPPFGYVDEASKQIVGFEIDLMAALAAKLGVKLEIKPVTSSTRIPMLTQGDIDIICATMTHSRERDKTIDYSITYFMSQQMLLVKKDSGVKSIKDLAGKKIGSAKGSTSEQNARKAQPGATIVSFETYPEAFLALKQGKVDAVTTDDAILLGIRNKDDKPEDFMLTGEPISAEPYGLGMLENDSKYRDAVNFALMEMWTTGEYQKIYEKWFGKDTKFFIPLTWTMELWP
jgi:polar amino acid transport system substrate-binding protein